MIEFHHRMQRTDIAFGIVVAHDVRCAHCSAELDAKVRACVEERRTPLAPALESRRAACREMLRNGSYKPTGRSKPASEYLLRAAQESSFPRINAVVDAANWVSLDRLVPISLWDLELAVSGLFEFRLGTVDEQYVFNAGGQVLELRDLICGAALDGAQSTPIVNPVKDSLRTKTTPDTQHIAACVYFPVRDPHSLHELTRITAQLLEAVLWSNPSARGSHGVALPGQAFTAE